nr:hypothetical protein [Kineosporia babensis]
MRPGAKIGMVRHGDLTVRVEPKLPIGHVLFLLGYAARPVGWSTEVVGTQEVAGFVPAVADAFARIAEDTVRQGLLQGYRRVSAAHSVAKGKLLTSKQLRTRYGAALPVEISYDRFGADIAENQVLKAAAEQVLRWPGLASSSRARLSRLLRTLGEVTADRAALWRPSRLNRHYHQALELAGLILADAASGLAAGRTPAFGFVAQMDVIYENFLAAALGQALTGRVPGQARAKHEGHLDVGRKLRYQLDFTWLVDGRPRLIVDAKYKFGAQAHRADIYQMVGYCSALAVPVAHLVYADGTGSSVITQHELTGSGIRVERHALDLSLPPQQLLAAVDALAVHLTADLPVPLTSGVQRNVGARPHPA